MQLLIGEKETDVCQRGMSFVVSALARLSTNRVLDAVTLLTGGALRQSLNADIDDRFIIYILLLI